MILQTFFEEQIRTEVLRKGYENPYVYHLRVVETSGSPVLVAEVEIRPNDLTNGVENLRVFWPLGHMAVENAST